MRAPLAIALLAVIGLNGCATTRYTDTSRTGMEQLLISNAIDQALDHVEFPQLAGESVFVDDKYIECVDKAYIVGCVRHRVLAVGAKLADKVDNADVVLEIRSGGVGTDKVDSFLGVPPVAIPGPVAINLPEIKLMGRHSQTGTAKLGIVAYRAKERTAIGQGGMTLAKSHDNGWMILGIGPYFTGEVREEITAATSNRSISEDAVRAAAERGYRNAQGNLATVTLADGRATALASAHPAATASAPGTAVADARGRVMPAATMPGATISGATLPGATTPGATTPCAVRPVSVAPSGVPGGPLPGSYPLAPPRAPQQAAPLGPLGPLPGMPSSGLFPAMPPPAAPGGF
jgi:Family of unknown function (DUF6655)